jgi:hypothetical protein
MMIVPEVTGLLTVYLFVEIDESSALHEIK